LGAGLHQTGKINETALERNIKSLRNFVQIASDNEVKEIFAVGTMALRTAKNICDLIKQVADQCGVKIEIIGRKLLVCHQIGQTSFFLVR
jgi:exopolyphosphatase/guanosine-5'-triphosphate,3'-diphosphate pyrophosphatase